jgi:hypothetical protein
MGASTLLLTTAMGAFSPPSLLLLGFNSGAKVDLAVSDVG